MTAALVSTGWLADRLGDANLAVIDASWYMTDRDPEADFLAAHIPGAVRFSIDKIADPASDLPHTLASPDDFAKAVGGLGISEDMTIVVYDGSGIFAAPRVWWNFRVMGAKDVHVLDGGFPKWQAENRPVESGPGRPRPARTFTPRFDAKAVAGVDDVRTALADGTQVVDARSGTRFRGEEAEPRPGVEPGHMPGARNVHYQSVLENGQMKDKAGLEAAFAAGGVDLDKPMVTTCGSGVSAAILALAAETLGRGLPRLYDGSWAEWGSRPDTPKVKG